MARSPREINAEILSALDVRAEYEALGVRTSGALRDNGMLSCFAFGREDSRPSAWINVKTGYYGDSGGHNSPSYTMSLWDFAAVKAGKFPDWKAARKAYAEKVGVTIGRVARPEGTDWREKLELQDWSVPGNDILALRWCLKHKPGVSVDAIKAAGGFLAYYPCYWDKKEKKQKRASNVRQVIAVPCYGDWLLDADPVAWVIWDVTGHPFDVSPKGHSAAEPPVTAKMISVGPTRGTVLGLSSLMILCDPELRPTTARVWKVEGPADMMALWESIPAELRASHLVVTNGGGATSDVLPHQSKLLAGLRVDVCGDCDEAGQVGAQKWIRSIEGMASEVRNVVLPWPIEPKHGADVRDYLTGMPLPGGEAPESPKRPYSDLLALADAATPIEAAAGDGGPAVDSPAATDEKLDRFGDEQIAKALKIDVLGRTIEGDVKVYSEHYRRTTLVRSVAKLKFEDLLNHFGAPVRRAVSRTNEDSVPGMWPIRDVREAIAFLGGIRMLGDETELGLGCWPLREKNENGEHGEGEVLGAVLVGARDAAHYNGEFFKIDHPRHNGHLLCFESGAKPWYDFDTLGRNLKAADDPAWRFAVADDLYNLFSRWRWKGHHDPTIVSALVFCTWVQTFWDWRPRVDILGASNTGKSMLCLALQGLFQNCCLMTSDTTAAGLRQRIFNRAVAVIVDEVDAKNKTKLGRQKEILEMIRSASRGTASLRGSGNQQAVEFTLRHLVWVAGITLSYDDQADRNRAIMLNLQSPLPEMAGKLTLPSRDELGELGQRALAVALWASRSARAMAIRLKDSRVVGADPRIVESYSVPAAMMATILGYGDEAAAKLLADMLETAKVDIPQDTDEADIIADILQAQVRMDRYNLTVGQAILLVDNPVSDNRDAWRMALETNGIKIGVYGRNSSSTSRPIPDAWENKACLILNYRMIRKALLRGTRWEGQSIDQVLRRLPGCITNVLRVGGQRGRVAMLPLDEFVREYINGDESQHANEPATF